ncbi:hypothetical protein, partial [Escherichia coli]|uniref:hypothetical protein n=1 Tax=Escherichia coli TaxID=562 RepID=UPI00195479C0
MRAQHTQAISNKRAITSETLVNQAQNKLVNIRSTKNAPHVVMQRVDFCLLESRSSAKRLAGTLMPGLRPACRVQP